MRTFLILATLMLAALPCLPQELYYRSDQMGMMLAPLPPALRDDSRWVVGVTRRGSDEDRRLYDNGKEVRRWETTWNADGTRRVERESAGGALTARRVYDSRGALLQEDAYAGGTLSGTTLYSYLGGRLVTRRELDARGKEQSRDTYIYADDGRLREVRHTLAGGGADLSSAVSGGSGLAEQRTLVDGTLLVERYDADGRLIRREKKSADGSSVVEDLRYDAATGKLASTRERRSAEGAVVDRRYDAAGLLAEETITVKGVVSETSDYQHDSGGRVTVRTRRSAAGIETWRYTYTDSGDLRREEYFQRGVLTKVTVHGDGRARTEELYRDGELFLKVYYDGDTRLREEVYDNGRLIRERTLP